ncbi:MULTISPECIES: helix-turn-helix domain-containing protein [Serratia]|jgi:transcriptional regulator with XRE-family HTH domain|uniref:helix-turn-helix domain-containing protein n=1 Tax=Serratia TaxID=613 RepID=UPI00223F2108|nr:helix-turn-helix transcriptional regulator [Serratia grimesii]
MNMLTEQIRSFFYSRRCHLKPADLGIADDGKKRRVKGLRRDELAESAGLSVEYYTKLEQGRVNNPSLQTLSVLADVLRLDASERQYLYLLFNRERPLASAAIQSDIETLQFYIESFVLTPAYFLDARLDIISPNFLARKLITGTAADVKVLNLARVVFLDKEARNRYGTWREKAEDTAAMLRFAIALFPQDPYLFDLHAELYERSDLFRMLWNQHRVLEKTNGYRPLFHPDGTMLETSYETFTLNQNPSLRLVVYFPKDAATRERLSALQQ